MRRTQKSGQTSTTFSPSLSLSLSLSRSFNPRSLSTRSLNPRSLNPRSLSLFSLTPPSTHTHTHTILAWQVVEIWMVERMIFRMMSRTFENNLRQTVPEDRHDHTVYYSGSNVDELKEVLQVCERPPHTQNLLAASDCTFPPFTQFFFSFFFTQCFPRVPTTVSHAPVQHSRRFLLVFVVSTGAQPGVRLRLLVPLIFFSLSL